MRKVDVSLPQLALIAGTRGLLGAGVGMLLADRVPKRHKRKVGWGLVALGVLSTVPLAAMVFKGLKERKPELPEGEAAELPERESMTAEL